MRSSLSVGPRALVAAAVMAASMFCASAASAAPITGSLMTSTGVTAGGLWATQGFKIAWSIDQVNAGTWRYTYTLTNQTGVVLTPQSSHIILQTSSNFTSANLLTNPDGNGTLDSIGTFSPSDPGNSNPNLPGNIFGMKVTTAGTTTITFSFDSNRQPMWGDFYSKGGNAGTAWNKDFGVTVANPNDYLNPARNQAGGLIQKILVPDTLVPTPGAFGLAGVAGVLAVSRRRR
ncbi:MAG: hypothetical protein IBJ11_03545 [Phycisphaerales bacterium]|nr:hypothetical protein [Phycisphaerales bacterium]